MVAADPSRIERAPCDLISWLSGLTVTQGEGAGGPLRLLDWQRAFVGGLEASTGDVALSVARGNGKSTLCAGLAVAGLVGPLARARGEVVLVASSFAQARITFDHARSFLETMPESRYPQRATWRVHDTANVAAIEHRATGARLRCIGSDPRRAHGLAPLFVLCDEPAQWPESTADRMLAALRTSLGKIPGSRLIALGTMPADGNHWMARMMREPDVYAQIHAAAPDADPGAVDTWRVANPSLDAMPALRKALEREWRVAEQDPGAAAAFRALRLNRGTSDTEVSELVSAETWAACEGDAPRCGTAHVGLDLGGSTSMTAAACYWPASSRLECYAAFPNDPDLARRGLRDGVGGLYRDAAAEGCLTTYPGKVTPVAPFLSAVTARLAGENVASLSCDRFRSAELADAMRAAGVRWRVRHRGQGWRDGAEDVRAFQRAAVDGKVRAVPNRILRWSIAEARTIYDPSGNAKLDRRRARSRIDAAQAAVLAVSAGVAEASRPAPSYVPGVAGGAGR